MEEDKEEEEEEFNDTMEREEDSEVDTTYVVQRSDLTDSGFRGRGRWGFLRR
jgi:hypothetical protein